MKNEERSERVGTFIGKHGIACGGNWANMAMSAIERGLPKVFKELEDKQYDFFELHEIIADNTYDA